MPNITLTESQVKLLLSFAPKETAAELKDGLCPTFYFSGAYQGDLYITERIDEIRKLVNE